MHKLADVEMRRARYVAMGNYVCSKAIYSAKAEDQLYWQKCATFWQYLAAHAEAGAPTTGAMQAASLPEPREQCRSTRAIDHSAC